jgi:signal transduction histidine kinase
MSSGAQKCAAMLEENFKDRVLLAETVARARVLARAHEFAAVVLDEAGIDADVAGIEALVRACGTAVLVSVNLGIHSAERVLREVRLSVQRWERERAAAMKAAAAALRGELKGELTGILMASQLALSSQGLPKPVEERLRSVYDIAQRIRTRLE